MIDGIYHVTFSSNSNDFGEGIAVFKGSSVNGGDHGYLYTGTTTRESAQFTSTLTIRQWNPAVHSIFGPIKEFVLELNGTYSNDNSFLAHGYVTGQPQAKISIRGQYLSATT
ncbi:GrlR family regulatory protein [Xanthomonas sacchari]|uniref:GrlR family regulatory protein n=1 Tax=Xanthomonas sacchari TaxID=56458 RepID=UPI00225A05A2|nr:GrlR family regulatory protein [Xanthomonas sacchari]